MHNSAKVIVEQLTALVQSHGEKLLSGQTKLALTTNTLNCLNRCFQFVNNEASLEKISTLSSSGRTERIPSESSFEENIQFIYEFIKQILTLKVTQGIGTLQGSVDVSHFSSLKILEIKRIPIHLFVGLQSLRTRLQMITCERCLQSLEDLFSSCGGDRSSPFSWPELLSANLSFNTIERMDSSLRLIPALVMLDISHNFLQNLDGLEYLMELEYLNLSYNQLKLLPLLSSRACARLKVLVYRNNMLESLDGLDRFVNLQQVDLAYNCLLDHCSLAPFLRLSYVKSICVEGNPISYHDQHRQLSIEHFHQRLLTSEFTLDGIVLKNAEIIHAKKFLSNCQTWKHSAHEWNEGSSINTERVLVQSSGSINSHNNDCHDNGGTLSECDFDSSVELDDSKLVLEKNKKTRKNRVVRNALIDEVQVDKAPVDNLKAVQPCSPMVQQSSEPSNDHQQSKQEIERFREQHGSDWLVIGSKVNVLPRPIEILDTGENGGFPRDTSVIHNTERMNRISRVSDDVVVLSKESESSSPPIASVNETSCAEQIDTDVCPTFERFSWEQTPHDGNSDDEKESDDAYSAPFIIQMEKLGMETSETILVIVSDYDLQEKNFLTGRTMERLEFRSIRSFETLPLKNTAVDGVIIQQPRIHINFNYVRMDRKERIYTMDDQESYKQFCTLLQSVVDANTFNEMTLGALQCLKCSSQFSKDGAKKIARKSKKPPNDIIVLSSSAANSREEANACPNCGSEMVIELEQSTSTTRSLPPPLATSASPRFSYLDVGATGKFLVGMPVNQSTPMSFSSRDVGDHTRTQNLGSSCPFSTGNHLTHSRTAPSLLGASVEDSSMGCCNVVEVQVEVHTPQLCSDADDPDPRLCSSLTMHSNSIIDGAGLRRSESDITILSNPSQSSILVMPNPSSAELSLSAIAESSMDCNRLVASLSSKSSVEIQDSIAVCDGDEKTCLGINQTQRLDSCSSGSLTGSACTTVEKSVYDISVEEVLDRCTAVLNEKKDVQQLRVTRHLAEKRCGFDETTDNLAVSEESTELIHDNHSQSPNRTCEASNSVPNNCISGHSQMHGALCISSSTSTKQKTWSCQDSVIAYSFTDFGQIDHRLKLYLDMEILTVEEELVAVLRAGVVPYIKGEEGPGLLVITSMNVHILKITGSETDQPQVWLQKFDRRSISLLFYLNVRLGSQAFQLEFGPESAPTCFTFLLRDADHCNSFICYLMEKTKSGILNMPESQLHISLDSDESLQTIREQLLNCTTSDDTIEPLSSFSSEVNELNIGLYLMGYWIPSGYTEFQPVSIVTTFTDIFLFTEDLHWPLPHLILPSNDLLARPQLIPQMHLKIQDLTVVEQFDNRPLEIYLKFLDEECHQESTWPIALETERSMKTFIQALKDPWERLFGVELQVSTIENEKRG